MNLKQSDLLALALFLAASIVIGFVQLTYPTSLTVLIWKTPDIKVSNSTTSADLNTATYEELLSIPDINSELAERILSYRDEHGSFENLEELRHIEGIDAKFLEKLKVYLHVRATKEKQN